MTEKEYLSVARLHELLRYDLETGKLFWRSRTADDFSSPHWMRVWNTKNAGKEAGWVGRDGYRRLGINRVYFLSHRVVWVMAYGYWPEEIDHFDQDRQNNLLTNLRDVPHQVNSMNTSRMRNNTSGCTGVHRNRHGNWGAEFQLQGVRTWLGTFKNFNDAVKAIKNAHCNAGFTANHGRLAE